MAKSKVLIPLTAEDHEQFIRVVTAADGPLESSKIVKAAALSRRPKPAEVLEILDQLVARGSLIAIPPESAKGKILYWDREPAAEVSKRLLDILSNAAEPMSVKDIKTALNLPFKIAESLIVSQLEVAVKNVKVHEIPPKTAKGGPRYWNKGVQEYARLSVLSHLQSHGPLAEAKLQGVVKWLDKPTFQQVVSHLQSTRQLYKHPPLGSSKYFQWGNLPPTPEPYLREVGVQFIKIVETLRAAHVPDADLRRAAMRFLDSAGIQLGSAGAGQSGQTSASSVAGVDLVRLMKQVEPAAGHGALVTTRVLRQAAGLGKQEFDAIVLRLTKDGVLALHEHDFPSSLSPEARDQLVTDGRGSYYVGVALRR